MSLNEGNGSNDITRREFIALTKTADDTNEKVTATDLTVMRIETTLNDFMAQHVLYQKRGEDDYKEIKEDYKRRFAVMYSVIVVLVLGTVASFLANLFGKG